MALKDNTSRRFGRREIRRTRQAAVRAVAYARVSTPEQHREGYSIPAQINLLEGYAVQNGIDIVETFGDVETARKSGRSAFGQMLKFFRRHPHIRGLLVEKTDRLYRNLKDWAIVDDLDLEIHLVKENSIMSQDCRSSEKFVHGIKVLMAKAYIDNLSEETRKGMLQKAQLGIWPTVAPIGYVNVAEPSGRKIIAVDPDLGPLVTRLFDWFSTGDYSVKAVAARARSAGLCYRKSRKPVATATVHSILRHRIYTGSFEWLGEQYEGIHQPLTSPVLWEAVQRLLDQRSPPAGKRRVEDFSFHGLVECGHCGCALVAEVKKGRYVYYHCTGFRRKCPEPYVRQERLEEHFAEALARLDCGASAFATLQREVFHRYGDHLADGRGGVARHSGRLRPISTDAFAEDGVALLNMARTAHRSLPPLCRRIRRKKGGST